MTNAEYLQQRAAALGITSLSLFPVSLPDLWAELHRRALRPDLDPGEAEWFAGFSTRVPCGECRRELSQYVIDFPPRFATWSPQEYFAWSVDLHNHVNVKLGRREWMIEEAQKRWAA